MPKSQEKITRYINKEENMVQSKEQNEILETNLKEMWISELLEKNLKERS